MNLVSPKLTTKECIGGFNLQRNKTYQEDQTMQKQGVEEGNSPGHLVGENHTPLKETERERDEGEKK